MRIRKNRLWILLLSVMVFALVLSACGKDNSTSNGDQAAKSQNDKGKQSDKSPKTLTIALDADAKSLDPVYVADGPSSAVIANIAEGLLGFEPGSGKLIPVLAENWDVEDNGKVFVFHLRQGVKFHDGTDFNAEVVKFNIERQMEGNKTEDMPNAGTIYGNVEKVEVVDPATVKVTLKTSDVTFLSYLAYNPGSQMLSPDALKKDAEGFKKHPVGTGPFMFDKWEPDQYISLKAFGGYWGGKPKSDQVVYKVIKESAVRTSEMIAGSVDILSSVDIHDVEKLKSSGMNIIKSSGSTINYIALYNDTKPFNDKRVRQAINMGVNREELVKGLYGDNAVVAKGPIPPNTLGYFDDVTQLPYDPEKAKQLLKDAGYEKGLEFTLLAYNVQKNYNPAGEKLALALQNELAKINVKVNVITKPWNEFTQDLFAQKKQGEAIQIGWGSTIGDPSDFIMLLESANGGTGLNFAEFKNEKLDQLAQQAKTISDPTKRAAVYKQITEIFNEEAPWLLISHSIDYAATSPKVEGYLGGRGSEKTASVFVK